MENHLLCLLITSTEDPYTTYLISGVLTAMIVVARYRTEREVIELSMVPPKGDEILQHE